MTMHNAATLPMPSAAVEIAPPSAPPPALPQQQTPSLVRHRLENLTAVMVPFAGFVMVGVLLGLVDFHWSYPTILGTMYVLTGLGITIGFHRLFTHRSFETGRFWTWVWAVLGSMALEGPVLQWVAQHRRHHQHSDSPQDPHSPHNDGTGWMGLLRGLWHSHMGWMIAGKPTAMGRYVDDLRKDRLIRRVSRQFPLWVLVGLFVPAALGGLLTWSWMGILLGFLWGGLLRIFLVHHITWSINSVCHLWGARPFETHDESRNNLLFGVLGFGEGWHNNHHAFPNSARHGLAWWQLDVSYMIIRVMELLGIARQVRVPASDRIASKLRRPQVHP